MSGLMYDVSVFVQKLRLVDLCYVALCQRLMTECSAYSPES